MLIADCIKIPAYIAQKKLPTISITNFMAQYTQQCFFFIIKC